MADITFNCQYCEQKIEAPAEMAGMKAECASYQCELEIPNRRESPAKLTAAASSLDDRFPFRMEIRTDYFRAKK